MAGQTRGRTGKRIGRDVADRLLTTKGWLSQQPVDFQRAVLNRSILEKFDAGEIIYRVGDSLGGIYGLVSGIITINTAPKLVVPKLIHVAEPGQWTGEGCFLTRTPRRLELRALVDTWMMHLPLSAMDQMAENSPDNVRRFAAILMASTDVLIRIIHDLQIQHSGQRIASVLHRAACCVGDAEIPMTQAEIGAMANASRKQVNAALQKFEAEGWVETNYRSLRVKDAKCLCAYSSSDD